MLEIRSYCCSLFFAALSSMVLGAGTIRCFAQGQIIFNNQVSATVVAPVYDIDPNEPYESRQGNTATGVPTGTQTYVGPLLAGPNYVAQLFAGSTNTTPQNLPAVGRVAPFRSGSGAGFIVAPNFSVSVPGVNEGARARLQMRVWNSRNGTITNWQQVIDDPSIERGLSESFISPPLGGIFVPPPNLIGLESFNLTLGVPVPLTLTIQLKDGIPELTTTGPNGHLCHIEYHTRVDDPGLWIEVTDFVLTTVPYVARDPGATNAPLRIYRASLLN